VTNDEKTIEKKGVKMFVDKEAKQDVSEERTVLWSADDEKYIVYQVFLRQLLHIRLQTAALIQSRSDSPGMHLGISESRCI
jgi:hypothetical protein